VTVRSDDLGSLVAAAQRGDAGAFDSLVKATHAETYTLAYRLTGDVEDARDVTQDTYLRAYRALARFRGDARFQTWLYRITANSASTLLGQRARHRHDELIEEAPVPDERIQVDPVARAEGTSLRHHLTDALRRLPPGLRSVVVLRDVYDLPHDAIADELDISVTAAKVRLHRARRRLREDLYAHPHEGEARAV
jgi:RNA polymerase sigma-70 factor, ECF subfamily